MIDPRAWSFIEQAAYNAGAPARSDQATKNQALAIAKMITAALQEYDKLQDNPEDQTK